jgi:histidine ammonia-lyase
MERYSSLLGLAMINGTQFMASLGTEALIRAERAAIQADIVAALTVEALQGTHKAFDARVSRHV